MSLRGKRAIVTGSSSGIGQAIAVLLAAQGVQVVINASGTGRTGELGVRAVAEQIRASGGTAIGIAAAVNDPAAAERLVQGCVAAFGGIDILINNAAAISPEAMAPVDKCSVDAWRDVMRVNIDGVFNVSRLALPHMVRQRWGRILNAGSLAGLGDLGGSAYAASKSALFGLTRAMAADYGPYGITVNCYNPEARTPMGNNDDDANYAAMHRKWVARGYQTEAQARYRIGVNQPNGVAPWVAYLCTDDAEYLNGQIFAVEGRRIAMLAELEERRVLYRDFKSHGPWTLDELALMAPQTFSVCNAWPRRNGDDLDHWERA